MDNLVIDDIELEATALGSHTPDVDSFQYTVKETNTKILKIPENTSVIHGPIISWTATKCSKEGYTFVSGGGSITDTSNKCFSNKTLGLFKKGAIGNCTGKFTQSSSPFSPYVCNCSIKISNAGQDKISIN